MYCHIVVKKELTKITQCGINAEEKINLRDVNILIFHEPYGVGPV